MKVQELAIYPLKSARAQKLKEMRVTAFGPEGDREWMLVDADGKFISQRTHSKMATIDVLSDGEGLSIGLNKMFFKVPRRPVTRTLSVQIWNDTVEAALEPDLFSQALSQYLETPCRLVRYTALSKRKLQSLTADWSPEVRFADGRPLQILNLKSLEDLNSKLESPVGTDRFRANIIFDGTTAFEEDTWKRIQIGEVIFSQPKPCARCIMITMDQKTGLREGPEPLKTLSTYRKDGSKVLMGSLWIPENAGVIRPQDPITRLD